MKRVAVIILMILCLTPLSVYSQSSFIQDFPSVRAGNYFVWDANTTKANSSLGIAGVVTEMRGEKINIDSVRETPDFVEINITTQHWKYINGTKTDVKTSKLTLVVLSSAFDDTDQLLRFFRVSNLYNAFRDYIEGLSGFFMKNNTNFTMLIEEGYFTYKGQNRNVLIGLLEGYTAKNEWTHAKYIVDKEYGVLLAREFLRVRTESGNISTAQHSPLENEIMVLKDTNLFSLIFRIPSIVIMIVVVIAIVVATIIYFNRRR